MLSHCTFQVFFFQRELGLCAFTLHSQASVFEGFRAYTLHSQLSLCACTLHRQGSVLALCTVLSQCLHFAHLARVLCLYFAHSGFCACTLHSQVSVLALCTIRVLFFTLRRQLGFCSCTFCRQGSVLALCTIRVLWLYFAQCPVVAICTVRFLLCFDFAQSAGFLCLHFPIVGQGSVLAQSGFCACTLHSQGSVLALCRLFSTCNLHIQVSLVFSLCTVSWVSVLALFYSWPRFCTCTVRFLCLHCAQS